MFSVFWLKPSPLSLIGFRFIIRPSFKRARLTKANASLSCSTRSNLLLNPLPIPIDHISLSHESSTIESESVFDRKASRSNGREREREMRRDLSCSKNDASMLQDDNTLSFSGYSRYHNFAKRPLCICECLISEILGHPLNLLAWQIFIHIFYAIRWIIVKRFDLEYKLPDGNRIIVEYQIFYFSAIRKKSRSKNLVAPMETKFIREIQRSR